MSNMRAPKHCKGCVLLSQHTNHRTLSQGQKAADNWCCAKGQKANKAVAYCKTHNLKRQRLNMLTDEQIVDLRKSTGPAKGYTHWADTIGFARALKVVKK